MQVVFREGVPSISRDGPNVPLPPGTDRRKVAMAWALIEAEAGRFEGETCRSFFLAGRDDRLRIELSRSVVPLDDKWGSEAVPEDEVTGVFRQFGVRADAFQGLTTFGRLFTRRTDFPVADGCDGFVAAGLVVNSDWLPQGALFRLEGENLLVETSRSDVPDAIVPGMAASRPFRTPIWGFGDEPRAFVSTMRRDAIKACARFAHVDRLADRTPQEARDHEALRDHPSIRSVFGGSRNDEAFASWKEFAASSGRWEEAHHPMDAFPTAAEMEAAKAVHEALFSEWHSSREHRGPAFR